METEVEISKNKGLSIIQAAGYLSAILVILVGVMWIKSATSVVDDSQRIAAMKSWSEWEVWSKANCTVAGETTGVAEHSGKFTSIQSYANYECVDGRVYAVAMDTIRIASACAAAGKTCGRLPIAPSLWRTVAHG